MRKETNIVITAEGRDKGKMFHIREMSASAAEDWAARFFMAVAKANADVPPDIASLGMAGIAVHSIRSMGGIPWAEAKELLAEMFTCVTIIPDPNRPEVIRSLVEDDIEEVATRLKLREEVITLHTGFSIAESLSSSMGMSATDQSSLGQVTEMFQETSPRLSPAVLRRSTN